MLQDYSRQVERQVLRGLEENMLRATMEWHRGVVEMLTGTRSGRTYKRSHVTYRASAPGEPPASVTGQLRSSYRFRTITTGSTMEGQVGSPLAYAVYLEHGTQRMAPRPHLLPAYYAREAQIQAHLEREVGK